MPITTTPSERIGRCTRMRRFLVRFNRPESFVHTRSSAGFTIITYGLSFRYIQVSSSGNLNGAVEMDAVLRASNIARLNIPQTLLARADE
jgi:hypothetical protein